MAENSTVNVRDEFLKNCKEHNYLIRVYLPHGFTVDGYVKKFDKDNLTLVSKHAKNKSSLIPNIQYLFERAACLWIEQLID